MPAAAVERLRRIAVARPRHEILTSNAWYILRTSLAPLVRLNLRLICRRDLTEPLAPLGAKLSIEVKAAAAAELEQVGTARWR